MKRIDTGIRAGIFAIAAASFLSGQTMADGPQFEAVAIRPSPSGARGGGFNLSPGRLNARNRSLGELVQFAFDLREYQLKGGPPWLDAVRYEILATYPAGGGDAERRRMMQAMLAERFRLAVHRESAEVPGYELVAGRNGARIRPVEPGQGGMMLGRNPATGQRTLNATSADMAGFADMLATLLGRPVEDGTGLRGVFDFTLEWSPDETQAALDSWKEVPGERVEEAGGASLFTAVDKTLGLALKARKVRVEVVVIDRAEKPSAN